MSKLPLNSGYRQLFAEIKQKIKQAQLQALITANQQMLLLYWDIGNMILKRQEQAGWGAKVAEQLSKDLKKEFPGMKGFSRRNILLMRQFATTYPDFEFVQEPLAQISWYNNITLIQKCKGESERLWYARQALKNGWLRIILVLQIESNLYARQGKAPNNFHLTST